MTEYVDLCLKSGNKELSEKAQELGWKDPSTYSTMFLKASDWGELKKKIKQTREENEILVYMSQNEKLDKKAVSDPRIDVILQPGKGRKEKGVDKVIAEKAAENNVKIGLNLQTILKDSKEQVHALNDWRNTLKLCEKYDVDFIITSGAEQKYQLRSPRDIISVISSLGFNGEEALEVQQQLLNENKKKLVS